jgi:hypothetical protein
LGAKLAGRWARSASTSSAAAEGLCADVAVAAFDAVAMGSAAQHHDAFFGRPRQRRVIATHTPVEVPPPRSRVFAGVAASARQHLA